MLDVRCRHKLHAQVSEDASGSLWKYCDSKYCKERDGEIVIHEFNLGKRNEDGNIYPINTERIKRPEVRGINK